MIRYCPPKNDLQPERFHLAGYGPPPALCTSEQHAPLTAESPSGRPHIYPVLSNLDALDPFCKHLTVSVALPRRRPRRKRSL